LEPLEVITHGKLDVDILVNNKVFIKDRFENFLLLQPLNLPRENGKV
jgi:hypothetical protein